MNNTKRKKPVTRKGGDQSPKTATTKRAKTEPLLTENESYHLFYLHQIAEGLQMANEAFCSSDSAKDLRVLVNANKALWYFMGPLVSKAVLD